MQYRRPQRHSQISSNAWKYQLSATIALLVILFLVGWLMTISTSHTVERLWRLFDPEAQQIVRQEFAATSSTRIATTNAKMILGVAVKGTLLIGAIVLMSSAAVALLRRSRTYYAHDGLFPTIEVEPGVFYDINRALGEDNDVTAHALEVQRHQAMAAAGPFPAIPQSQPQGHFRSQEEPGLIGVVEVSDLQEAAQSGLLPAKLAQAIDGKWREVADAAA